MKKLILILILLFTFTIYSQPGQTATNESELGLEDDDSFEEPEANIEESILGTICFLAGIWLAYKIVKDE